MNLPKYAVYANAKHDTYEFLSSGSNGTVKKVVRFTKVSPGLFNLGFGDLDENFKFDVKRLSHACSE
jgi:hypothetical protein